MVPSTIFLASEAKVRAGFESWVALGRVPKLFISVAVLYGVLDRKNSPLDPVLRSLVTVRVSQINWCRFCIDINSAVLVKRSGSQEKVQALDNWKESYLFDEKERIALEYTEAITYSDQNVSDELMERLLSVFDEDSVVELTGLIAFQNMSSKFNSAHDVLPQGFCNLSDPTKALNVKSSKNTKV